MRLLSTRALAGPNVWSKAPVLEARVQLAGWAQLSASAVPDFQQQLRAWLPQLVLCSGADDPAGGTTAEDPALQCAAQTLLDVTRAVQTLSRGPVEFGQVSETGEAHTHLLVLECEEAALAGRVWNSPANSVWPRSGTSGRTWRPDCSGCATWRTTSVWM